ncbi:MAG: nitroreductase [Frankiales bacterium]|jgi:deazaflavin-dependent oxidoreductase (nitroreductase family)|nr:nitroreductase [Frankiales bacterium]
MPLWGEYAPSSEQWVRDEVEHYERTDGTAWGDRPVVVLTSRGAVSGKLRKTPLMRVEHKGIYAAVASMAGAGSHPAWYHNVLAEPRVELQDGPRRQDMIARELSGPERAAWWSRACTVFPSYVDYQSRTRRRIPVFLLEPLPQEPSASR